MYLIKTTLFKEFFMQLFTERVRIKTKVISIPGETEKIAKNNYF